MTADVDVIRDRLHAAGQTTVLQGLDTLDPASQARLLEQLSHLSLESLPELIDRHVLNPVSAEALDDLSPAIVTDPDDAARQSLAMDGEALIRAGKIAAFTVAGGQGTRLGWGGPKGTFPASPVSGKPLFRLFAEQLQAASRRWETPIRWYIMTSEANDAVTRSFFADNNWFGIPRTQIMLFPQGMMPCFDATNGRMLMEAPDRVAMSPDGHGGAITALRRSGALEQMQMLGIEAISYFQVDNPMAPIIDPVFIGLHADATLSSRELSSKVVSKIDAAEKVGVFCQAQGRTRVIEYSDLPLVLQESMNADGSLRYDAGNIAVHMLGVDFAATLSEEDSMPWHAALKKVPCFDPHHGGAIDPSTPNGVKLERFVFDAIPLATQSAVLKVDRGREFSPIKNATGSDSPASCRQAQCDLFGGWLESRGVSVARDEAGHVQADIEISALTAMGPEDLADDLLPEQLGPEDRFVI